MHTLKKYSREHWWLIGIAVFVTLVTVYILTTPYPLHDTDQFGQPGGGGLMQAMDNIMFGAFVSPQTSYQDTAWHTYQNGPMTISYRTRPSAFDTAFTNYPNRNNSMMYGYGYGDPLGGALVTLLFWALIIAGAVVIIKYFMHGPGCHVCGRHHHGLRHGHGALDILAERYARGEIEKEEYETKKQDILG